MIRSCDVCGQDIDLSAGEHAIRIADCTYACLECMEAAPCDVECDCADCRLGDWDPNDQPYPSRA